MLPDRGGTATVGVAGQVYVGLTDQDEVSAATWFEPTLRAIAAYGLVGSTLDLPIRALADDAWRTLLRSVAAQRLSGLLLEAVSDDAFPVAEHQATELRRLHSAVMARAMLLEGTLLIAEGTLQSVGVPLRVLKGPATASLDYPSPTLRPFVDIDVLIRSEDFDHAVTTLTDAGYQRRFAELRRGFDRRFGKGASFTTPNGLGLDVHRTFVMGPYGLNVRLADLWAAEEIFTLAGRRFSALSAEMRLLHACYNAVLGDWPPRLLPHRDIAQLLLQRKCDAVQVLELSKHWRADSVLALGIVSAWDLLDVTAVNKLSTWASHYTPSERDRQAAAYAAATDSYAGTSLQALRAIPRLSDKLVFLRALAFPDASYLQSHASSRIGWLRRGLKGALAARSRG